MIEAISKHLPGSLRSQAEALGYHRNGWRGWVRGTNQPNATKVVELLARVQRVYGVTLTVALTSDGWDVLEVSND